MKLSVLFKEFFSSEKASGLILLLATISGVLLAFSIPFCKKGEKSPS